MKLNDLKKIEEGFFGNLKDKWRQGSYQNQVEKIFIQDFVQDAFVSLNNGVKGGLIDANIKSTPNAGSNTPPSSPASAPGAAPGTPTTESATYQKLNHLFENIVNTLEQAATGKMSISQYMMNWFGQYMQGVPWQGSKDTVQQMLDQLQDEYPKNATQNINNLARTAFALSKASSKPPAGAPDQFKKEKTEAPKKAEEIAADLGEIAATNPDLYKELYNNLPKPQAAPAAAAGTVAESRKRK